MHGRRVLVVLAQVLEFLFEGLVARERAEDGVIPASIKEKV